MELILRVLLDRITLEAIWVIVYAGRQYILPSTLFLVLNKLCRANSAVASSLHASQRSLDRVYLCELFFRRFYRDLLEMNSSAGSDRHMRSDGAGDISKTPSVTKGSLRKMLSIPESLRIMTDPGQDLFALSTVMPAGLKLPQMSPDTTERVFPIRSVVSVDSSTPSSALQTPPLESSETQISPFSEVSSAFSTGRDRSSSQPITPATDPNYASPTTEHGDSGDTWGHGLLESPVSSSKKDLSLANLQHIQQVDRSVGTAHKIRNLLQETRNIKAVYPFGALVVLHESEGSLVVQASSKNAGDVIGYTPEKLFRLKSFCNILRQDRRAEFLSQTNSIRERCYDVEQHGPDVLDLTITAHNGESRDFWCTIHANKDSPDYIFCEIEPQQSTTHSSGDHDDSRSQNPTPSRESHEETSDALEALEVFRMLGKSKHGFDYSNILNAVSRVTQLTATAPTIDVLFSRVVKILKEITGFNRATVYRFDSDWNGIAVADLTDPDLSGETFEDMHFLGSMFSEDLQTLHSRNKVRLSYNHRQHSPAELVYRDSISASQLDTSFCYLSTESPAPLELLSRRPVEACISIRINVFGKLWGLVSCKSYVQGTRLLPPLQKLCWLISDTLSSNIERLSYTLPFQMVQHSSLRKIENRDTVPGVDILSLFGADYAASSIMGETKILGKPYDSGEVLAIVEYMRARELDTIAWSTDVNKDFQDLRYPPGFRYVSSLLFIPLSADGRNFIVFFRTTQWREMTWVGCSNGPEASCTHEKGSIPCRPDGWSAVDLGKASVLSLIYKTFAEVWQQKETAMQNTQLMKLLLANCAHEFRTPLNAIINYLEIALDGSLSQETRDNLSRSHSASKSLVYIINDLLDLTNAENGQSLIKDEVFDLSGTINDATHIFGEEAKQKNVELNIAQHTDLPLVLGDQRRVRQVIMNLISNAVQHTTNGSVVIESCVTPDTTETDIIGVEVAVHDTGTGMSQETVEALFCELEEVSNDDYLQNSRCCRSKTDDTTGEAKNVLGLGLALVARIVHTMDGRLSVKSEKGVGSCFKLKLRFPLPSEQLASQSESGEVGKTNMDSRGTGSNDPQDRPATGEERNINPAKPKCENECSSRYGQTRSGKRSNSDIDIAISTESSELLHQSVTPTKHDSAGTESASESIASCPSSKAQNLSKPDGPVAIPDSDVAKQNPSPASSNEHAKEPPSTAQPAKPKSCLHVLVAEDDTVNSTIVRKRLEKLGHTVHLTVNGKECATAYKDGPDLFDAVLMDIQVPALL